MTIAITLQTPHCKLLDNETHQYQDLSKLNMSESMTPFHSNHKMSTSVTDISLAAIPEPIGTPEPQTQHQQQQQELSDYHKYNMDNIESNSRPKRKESIAVRRSSSTTKKIKPVYPLRIDVDPTKLSAKRKKASVSPSFNEQGSNSIMIKEHVYESRAVINSTSSSSSSSSSLLSRLAMSPSVLSPVSNHMMNVDLGDLDEEEHSVLREEIRARRLIRKQKKTYADDLDDSENESRINIGTRVSEGHRNYQMMYDMLTGIRIAVGRVCAKMKRELTMDDFTAAHKLVFDVTGNELTPGVKYDFKFKDYAPWVFRNLRERFHIDAADYMMSLTNKYILTEIGSPGKSGSFFYYSRDYRFIIKTIHHSEHKFMRKILKDYYEHVCNYPNTLLCRFYGLHRIKLPRGRKIHFVVMGNVLPSDKDIHETFDLKGSLFGRVTSDEEAAKNPHAVMKDQNWIKREDKLELGPKKRELLMVQLERDVEILSKLNIMDYSLLIGIHDIRKGNTECIRDHKLHMVTPKTDQLERKSSMKRSQSQKANIVRKAIRSANPENIDTSELPASPSEERKWCVFYRDDGGFRSSDEDNRPSDKLYYVGIIDILTPYNIIKQSEHIWKSITQDKNTISSVHPLVYGKRFLDFIKKSVNRSLVSPQEKKKP